jgi:hypothetical protein
MPTGLLSPLTLKKPAVAFSGVVDYDMYVSSSLVAQPTTNSS